MELAIPISKSPSGKVYRWCPNEECAPRLFLLGDASRPDQVDQSLCRRVPGTPGVTCPYCGTDADGDKWLHPEDAKAVKEKISYLVAKDTQEFIADLAKNFNRSQSRNSMISARMDVKSRHIREPRSWREDLLRNLGCSVCGRQYGVYAIALYCPDCGAKCLSDHFRREMELVQRQITTANLHSQEEFGEFSYRLLGNAHEDVLTAFEACQKVAYKHIVRKTSSREEAEALTSKNKIGNRFQNIERATALYKSLSINPFDGLTNTETTCLINNIEKRHVIGHNLSLVDEAYQNPREFESVGSTVTILTGDIQEFASVASKVIARLQDLY